MIKKNNIITCALPYVNNDLHLGHMFSTFIPADILARLLRLSEEEVIFFSGSDCHGIPILKSARKNNTSFSFIVKKYHSLNIKICKKFGISYDFFCSTKGKNHKKFVKKKIFKLFKKKYLYIKQNQIKFCNVCSLSSDQTLCLVCNKKNNEIVINDLFWKYDLKYAQKDIALKTGFFKKEVENLPFNQSKNITRIIPIGVKLSRNIILALNNKKQQKIYVWFEALFSYLSFLESKKKLYLWNKDSTKIYQFLGKDNLFFHTFLFSSILKSLNFKLVDKILVSNFLSINNEKFSKSKNRGIFCIDIIKHSKSKILINIFRAYLISIYGQKDDSTFNWENIQKFYQNIIIGKISNIFYRFNKFIFIYKLENWYNFISYNKFIKIHLKKINILFEKIENTIYKVELHNFFQDFIKIVDFINSMINTLSPWTYSDLTICQNELLLIFLSLMSLFKYLYALFPKKIINLFKKYHLTISDLFKAKKYNIEVLFHKIIHDKMLDLSKFRFEQLFSDILDWKKIEIDLTHKKN